MLTVLIVGTIVGLVLIGLAVREMENTCTKLYKENRELRRQLDNRTNEYHRYLNELTISSLKEIALEKGVNPYSMRKKELVDLLCNK